MKLLCITDPTTHPAFDTTVELYRRFAEDKEIQLFHMPCNVPAANGDLLTVPVMQPLSYEEFLALDQNVTEGQNIKDFDLIFDRSDKPFPSGYLSRLSEFEERAQNRVQFVNRPSSLIEFDGRGFLHKIAASYMPEYIFTNDPTEAEQFLNKHTVIVVKQNVSYGGKGVYKVWRERSSEDGKVYSDNTTQGLKSFANAKDLFQTLFTPNCDQFQLVRFLKNIGAGDKRVHVVDGEIYGGYIRQSTTGSWVHNITSGAKGVPATVTTREKEIVLNTVSYFQERGVFTLGYDFLQDDDGQWILSEINAGNIGGYDRLEKLSGQPVISRLVDWLVSSCKQKKFLKKV